MTDQRTARQRPKVWKLLGGAGVAAVAITLLTVSLPPADAGTTSTSPRAARPAPHPVAELDYNLGAKAFHVPGFHQMPTGEEDPKTLPLADIELTADVHYPSDLRGGPFPLVVLLHGYFTTCDDRAAAAIVTKNQEALERVTDPDEIDRLENEISAAWGRLMAWPCARGTAALPSYRGFDYLAKQLAAQGMVVVSISANGVNAGLIGDAADKARAALINKHLDMWRQLTTTGGGPLAGKLTDPATRQSRTVNFRGRVDLNHVGTLGHSRGGTAVAYHAAATHRAALPAGVRIASVLALAPARPGTATNEGSPDAPHYRVTTAPLAVWMGTCDGGTWTLGEDYIKLAAGHTTQPVYRWMVAGANHNYVNTTWSPSSGMATAEDDAPDSCRTDRSPGGQPAAGGKPSPTGQAVADHELTERQERQVAAGYITAFFSRTLLGRTADEAVISGTTHPYASITKVDAKRINPTAR